MTVRIPLRQVQRAALALGILLFAYLLWTTGWRSIVRDFSAIGWGIAIAIVLELSTDLINTVAWRRLFEPRDRGIPFVRLFLVRLAGTAYNQLLPGATLAGEPLKVVLLSRYVPSTSAWASVVSAKVSYAGAQAIFVTAALLLASSRLSFSWTVWGGAVTAVVVSLAGLAAFVALQQRGFFATVARGVGRFRAVASSIENLQEALRGLDAQVRDLYRRRRKDFVVSVVFHLSSFAADVFQVYLLLRWLGLSADVVACFAIEGFLQLLYFAFFFVPAGVGLREGGSMLVFAALGLPAASGLTIGVAKRLAQLAEIAAGLIGLACLYEAGDGESAGRAAAAESLARKVEAEPLSAESMRRGAGSRLPLDPEAPAAPRRVRRIR